MARFTLFALIAFNPAATSSPPPKMAPSSSSRYLHFKSMTPATTLSAMHPLSDHTAVPLTALSLTHLLCCRHHGTPAVLPQRLHPHPPRLTSFQLMTIPLYQILRQESIHPPTLQRIYLSYLKTATACLSHPYLYQRCPNRHIPSPMILQSFNLRPNHQRCSCPPRHRPHLPIPSPMPSCQPTLRCLSPTRT